MTESRTPTILLSCKNRVEEPPAAIAGTTVVKAMLKAAAERRMVVVVVGLEKNRSRVLLFDFL
jgi:hypothetical protein